MSEHALTPRSADVSGWSTLKAESCPNFSSEMHEFSEEPHAVRLVAALWGSWDLPGGMLWASGVDWILSREVQ